MTKKGCEKKFVVSSKKLWIVQWIYNFHFYNYDFMQTLPGNSHLEDAGMLQEAHSISKLHLMAQIQIKYRKSDLAGVHIETGNEFAKPENDAIIIT